MKTITELEKGCGRKYGIYYPNKCGEEGTEKRLLCEECYETLKQTKAIVEMIEKITGYDIFYDEFQGILDSNEEEDSNWISREYVLFKIKGEEK